MGNTIIEVEYYNWLLQQINYYSTDYKTGEGYDILLEELFNEDFVWSVPNDDNRAEDGLQLREIFTDEENWSEVPFEGKECSVLEMLIALARKIESEIMWNGDENRTSEWFWMMISNLKLNQFCDKKFNLNQFLLILNQFLTRNYEKSGSGGLFPLRENGENDQKKVEIWYQMQSFLMENYIF